MRESIFRLSWMMLAVSMPLFGCEIGRLSIPPFHVPLPFVLLLIATVIHALNFNRDGDNYYKVHSINLVPLNTLILLLFLWHLLSMFNTINIGLAIKEVTKFAISIASFYIVFYLFPRNKKVIEMFWKIALFSSSIILIYYLYYYLVVFKVGYLGIDITEDSRSGRNQLALYLAVIFPYVIAYSLFFKIKIISSLVIIITIVSLIYVGSRAAWLAALLSVIIMSSLGGNRIINKRVKMIAFSLIMVGFSLWGLQIMTTMSNIESNVEYRYRFLDLVTGLKKDNYSNQVRKKLLKDSLERFTSSPIIGIGIRNTYSAEKFEGHNDWLLILTEMGAVGFLLFLGIMVWIMTQVCDDRNSDWWVIKGNQGTIVAIVVSLLFIYAYLLLYLWVIYAIILVSKEVDRSNKDNQRITYICL